MLSPNSYPPYLRAFFELHGECIRASRASDDVYFRDGAAIMGSIPHDPPEDEIELAQARRRYLVRALQVEEAQWSDFRRAVSEQTANALNYPKSCVPPGEYEISELEKGKQRILALRENIDDIDVVIALSRREHEGQEAEFARRQHLTDFSTRLGQMQI